MARLIRWRRSSRAALVLTTLLALPALLADAAKESSVAT